MLESLRETFPSHKASSLSWFLCSLMVFLVHYLQNWFHYLSKAGWVHSAYRDMTSVLNFYDFHTIFLELNDICIWFIHNWWRVAHNFTKERWFQSSVDHFRVDYARIAGRFFCTFPSIHRVIMLDLTFDHWWIISSLRVRCGTYEGRQARSQYLDNCVFEFLHCSLMLRFMELGWRTLLKRSRRNCCCLLNEIVYLCLDLRTELPYSWRDW
jgi:hypothetical protein